VAGYLVIEIKCPESPKVSQSARAAVSFCANSTMRISSLNPFDLILGDFSSTEKAVLTAVTGRLSEMHQPVKCAFAGLFKLIN
jgi:hypothetical protein